MDAIPDLPTNVIAGPVEEKKEQPVAPQQPQPAAAQEEEMDELEAMMAI